MSDSHGGTNEFLDIRSAEGAYQRLALQGATMVIGRAADANILLESTTVSRQHAKLAKDEGGRWQIYDLDSRNGTLVNGRGVKEHLLSPGDQIQIGSFQLTLVMGHSFKTTPAPGGVPYNTTVHVSDDEGRLSTLKDMEPPRVAASHLTTLSELSQKLLVTADPRQRSLELCRLMISRQFHGDWALLLRVQPGAGDEAPEILCEPQRGPAVLAHDQQPHVSRSLLRAVAQQGEAVLASNVKSAAAMPANVEMSIAASVKALAAVACPLRSDERGLELLYVTLPPQYGTGEWLALASLAAKQYQQVEEAWEARARAATHAALERELEGAREIQMRLVPKAAALAGFKKNGVDVAIGFAPSRFVGGDYVDAVMLKDGRVFLTVADVCGHGLAAALVTSAVHTLVHAGVRAGLDLRALVDGLNQHLCETLRGDSFVTFIGLALDTANGAIECVNAGHPPLLMATTKGVRSMEAGMNLPLGLDAAPLEAQSETLGPDELLMIYSDGLSEQADESGKMLGIRGLTEKIQQMCVARGIAPESVAGQLGEFLAQRQGGRPPEDDQSYLFARRV
jgi:serine phosphatase RsbU (regulator of sigma subunit)